MIRRRLSGSFLFFPTKEYYWAISGLGSYKIKKRISNRSKRKNLIGTISRFHKTKKDYDFFKKHGINKIIESGAATKFCKMAEGLIDVYPRFNGSSEWDIAAGHMIIKEAGCKIISLKNKIEINYNKRSIRNDFFIASRNNLNFI